MFLVILPVRGNYSWVSLCSTKTVFMAGISPEHAVGRDSTVSLSFPERRDWQRKPQSFQSAALLLPGTGMGRDKYISLQIHSVTTPHLSSCSVWVDCNLTGAPTMAINCGCHLLPANQCFYFISWRHKLPAFGFLQRFVCEKCVFLHFGSWKLVTNPARQSLLL